MNRILCLTKLKPECIEEYKKYHKSVWPELELLYKRCGIVKLSCFLNGCELMLYLEVDQDIYHEMKSELDSSQIRKKWDEIMACFPDPAYAKIEFEEVYRME